MPEVSELLKKVRRIEIVARRTVNDLFAGQYKSVFRGRGMEFSEVREYQPGDDIRLIDWNVTARAGKPFIKQFVEERELTILFLVDVSASGVFGTARSKHEKAVEVAATLMFSALKNNDKVGLITFADRVVDYYRPRKGKANVLSLIRRLLAIQPVTGTTDIKSALDYVNRVQKRKAVLFLLSDFLVPEFLGTQGENNSTASGPFGDNHHRRIFLGGDHAERTLPFRSGLRSRRTMLPMVQERALSICARRHDLVAIPLSDPHERAFPDVGFITLQDAETGEMLQLDTTDPEVRWLLAKKLLGGQNHIAEVLKRCRVDRLPIDTESDFVAALRRFFKSREKRKNVNQ